MSCPEVTFWRWESHRFAISGRIGLRMLRVASTSSRHDSRRNLSSHIQLWAPKMTQPTAIISSSLHCTHFEIRGPSKLGQWLCKHRSHNWNHGFTTNHSTTRTMTKTDYNTPQPPTKKTMVANPPEIKTRHWWGSTTPPVRSPAHLVDAHGELEERLCRIFGRQPGQFARQIMGIPYW